LSNDKREIARKLRIIRQAEETWHVAKTCRYFCVGRSSFYRWREAYRNHSDAGLVKVCPPFLRTSFATSISRSYPDIQPMLKSCPGSLKRATNPTWHTYRSWKPPSRLGPPIKR